ncbi:WD40 repeat domain-containing protein [Streptomyces sp. NPDC096132]|uniref:WD40 repeat domain-containing protein n=1 Tax=Streptomyces sp. NPDC096132 TaxID=3366075 RepID=UPI0037F6B65D
MADAMWVAAWETGGAPEDPRLLRTLTGHEGWVTAVATTVVDGRAVAVTGSRDHTVRTWDLATGRQLHTPLVCRADTWTSTTAEVEHIATATMDGRPVALLLERLDREKRVLLLDPATGLPAGECVRAVEVSEADGLGTVLLTVEDDRTLRLWSTTTGEEIGSALPARILTGPDDEPLAVRAEIEGAVVRTWDLAGSVLDEEGPTSSSERSAGGAADGAEGRSAGGAADRSAGGPADQAAGSSADDSADGSPVTSAEGSADGSKEGSADSSPKGSADGPAEVSDGGWTQGAAVVVGGRLVAFAFRAVGVVGFLDGETAVAVVGELAAGCGRQSGEVVPVSQVVELEGRPVSLVRRPGGELRLWERGEARRTDGGGWAVTTSALRGQRLRRPRDVDGQQDWTRRLVHPAPATDAALRERLAQHTDRIRAAAAVPEDGERGTAVTTGLDRTVRVWDMTTGRQLGEPLRGHTAQVWDVATALLDGRPAAVTAGTDHTVRVWDIGETDGPPLPLSGGHEEAVVAAAATVLHGRPVVVTAGADRTVRTWDAATGAPVGEPVATEAALMATADADGSPVVVTAAPDATLHRWDLASGRETSAPVALPSGRILALATTRVDGRSVAVTGGSDGTARVWDLATGDPLTDPLTGHTSRITTLATLRADDRATAVTGSWDKTVRLWDLTTGRQLGAPLTGHTDWVTSVITTVVDGHPVAVSAGRDATVRVWSLRTHEQLGEPLPAPAGAIRGMTATVIDGRTHLITTNGTETLSIHDLTTGAATAPPLTFAAPVHTVLATPEGRLVVGHGREVSVLTPATPGVSA